MSTKESLLNLFEKSDGEFVSGESIAKELKVSRTAVWKAIKALKSEGYCIEAVTKKGYRLESPGDSLGPSQVEKYLDSHTKKLSVEVIKNTKSTNLDVKERAVDGAPEGLIIVSGAQSLGRGRRGRSFYSPEGSGIYFSVLLRPKGFTPQKAPTITTMAAVAVCEAIEKVAKVQPQIKWVNDILLGDKKVCGILTEASFDLESGFLDYAVLGIGINVYEPEEGFPEEIRDIAGGIFKSSREAARARLVAETLNSFFSYYGDDNEGYKQSYRDRSCVVGRDVDVIFPDKTLRAKVLDIDDDCHLLVEYEDGICETLSSGEISIRRITSCHDFEKNRDDTI